MGRCWIGGGATERHEPTPPTPPVPPADRHRQPPAAQRDQQDLRDRGRLHAAGSPDRDADLGRERRLPAVVHLGHNVNGRTDAEELPAIGEVADQFPGMRLILAHCGHHAAPEAIALMDLHPSLHADLTPVVTEHPTITAEHIARHPDRILFGSDCPNTTLSVTACIAWLTNKNVPEDVLQKVLGANALQLTSAVLSEGSLN